MMIKNNGDVDRLLRDVNSIVSRCILLLIAGSAVGQAQSFTFVGPDSTSWRQMYCVDVKSVQGRSAQIVATTSKGTAVYYDAQWHYILPNFTSCLLYESQCTWYKSALFSPLADSILLLASDIRTQGEGGSELSSFDYYRKYQYDQKAGSIPGAGYLLSYSQMYGDSSALYRNGETYLQKSYDGGKTWTNLNSSRYKILSFRSKSLKLFAIDALSPYSSPSAVRVYSTVNDGARWDTMFTVTGSISTAKIASFGDTLFLSTSSQTSAAPAPCGIFRSIDGGTSWSQLLKNQNVISMAFGKTPSTVYIATTDSLFRSVNGGNTWLNVFAVPFSKIVHIVKHLSADTLFVATADSGLFALTGLPVGVQERISPIEGFSLEQNFPNPFNPSTIFTFTLPRAENVSLDIFDVLGRKVSRVIDGKLSMGLHTQEWSASGMPSGVYFYRLQAGGYINTKRLILLR
jgi:hypothetical protein